MSALASPASAAAPPASTAVSAATAGAWRSACWLGALLFAVLAPLILAGAVEWEHYRRLLTSRGVELSYSDRLIVLWLLWAKSLLPLVPLLALVGGLVAAGRRRLASALLAVGAVGLFFWIAADLVVQRITGNHASDYLPHLHDAVLQITSRNHLEWAGDSASIVWRSLAVLGVIVVVTGLLLRACRRLASRLVARYVWLDSPGAAAGLAGLLLLLGVAALPAQAFFDQPLVARRLHAAMPVDLELFVPGASDPQSLWRLVLGRPVGRSTARSPVRIVSVMPNPPGYDEGKEQVTLHNFSGEPVSLDGWRLHDAAGHPYRLSGSLAAAQTLTLTLPADVLPLDNDGDDIVLVDAAGQVRHKVTYSGNLVKYGAVIHFPDEGEFDEFLFKTNHAVHQVYSNTYKALHTAHPVDDSAVFNRSGPPNVVYIVLESFRESAVSPEVMARLNAWGQQGLRMKRHYAGSNSSHLGLFTLLYGRSPLVYHPTVDAGIPPQTCRSLRSSGYELTFITSGDCTGFRKMDVFLNDTEFDHLHIENGQDWTDWPERDRRVFARLGETLRRPGKPQFAMVFLMSTHFPYAFPPEFDRHQPSGPEVTKSNWSKMDPNLLYNRYRNAALFLEDEIMKLVESLDPERNLVVVTGDHGESMSEDGALAHASRGSEVQTRVPLLMVGAGVPQVEIEAPTTHSDVLPTLLHALAGRHVPIAHAHGRDVLDGQSLADQVLVCPYRWKDPYDLILIRGQERMLFKIRLNRASAEAVGFCDEFGNLDLAPGKPCTEEDALIWTEAFRKELLRVVR